MIWKKITIETTTEAVDMISYTLGELGVEGIEIEDKVPLSEEDQKAMFIDILPELPPDDGVALISCYIGNGCGCIGGTDKRRIRKYASIHGYRLRQADTG